MEQASIYDYDRSDLAKAFTAAGFSNYKVRQLYDWLYKKSVNKLTAMSNLSKDFKAYLAAEYSFEPLQLVKQQVSADGTLKLLFSCADQACFETVIMRHSYGNSLCVSSQIGCLMGCRFCASGLVKKERDLKVGEMVLQVLQAQQLLSERIDNVVVMGSGEPFDNYDAVLKFLDIVNDDWGLGIGVRHLSLSTCGLVPQIVTFSQEKAYNLAISLHSADDEIRDYLMPINRKYGLAELKKALQDYSKEKNRRISLEYILFQGINDDRKAVEDLKAFMKGLPNVYLNLIPYNEVPEFDFKAVSDIAALKFYDSLKKAGLAVTLRNRRGDDIDAACGQLRNRWAKEK